MSIDASNGMHESLAMRLAGDAIMGGFDTIAIAMAGAMYFLLKDPTRMKRLTDEIRSTFETANDITLAAVNNLRYQNAVFAESLRLWPPGPETLRRVTNPGGNVINGEWVPPNVC
jgi:cytochrome P450